MNVVITMSGLGSRFYKAGYTVPKYMIEAKGYSLFYWSLLSLKTLFEVKNKFFFIVREEDHATEFIKAQCASLGILTYKIIEIDHLTDGQATTALFAKPYWEEKEPLLIYNIDTHVDPGALNEIKPVGDGWIPCFLADGDRWSFVKVNEKNLAVEVREKNRISNNATIGLYWFSSASLYEDVYNNYYSIVGNEEKGERYIAPLYNQMIKDNLEVTISIIPKDRVHILGTPEELEGFLQIDYKLLK
ncbi:hypothetical protein AMS62_14125 [Bacillus sp. FJAT-18019]|nr:hypothetical protein AMS62_14125 [Bacillus sp. FJAT-18019]